MGKLSKILAVGVFALPALAWAGDTYPQVGSSASKAELEGEALLEGAVEDVDHDKGLLTIQVRAKEGVDVRRDGRSVSFDEIREGDRVRARFDEDTGRVVGIEAISRERRERIREEINEDVDIWEE